MVLNSPGAPFIYGSAALDNLADAAPYGEHSGAQRSREGELLVKAVRGARGVVKLTPMHRVGAQRGWD
jgi:hypothetical protein